MPSSTMKRKTMTVGFHDLDKSVQQEIAKKCGFTSPFELAQGVFRAKLSFTWEVDFPMNDSDLDDLAGMMSNVSVDEKKSSSIKKKMKISQNKSESNMEEDTLDESEVDLEDEEFDSLYPDGIFFKYGSQTLWLSFAKKKIGDIINVEEYAAVVPHSFLKHGKDFQSALLIKGATVPTSVKTQTMFGNIKAQYLDDKQTMLVLTIPSSLKNNDDFNFLMNILAKAFAHQVPKNRKVFFGRMEDTDVGNGRWGMPNSKNFCHMLEKFGFQLV